MAVQPLYQYCMVSQDLLEEMIQKKSKDPFGTIRVARKALSRIRYEYSTEYSSVCRGGVGSCVLSRQFMHDNQHDNHMHRFDTQRTAERGAASIW